MDRRAAQGTPGCNVYVRGLQDKLTDDNLAAMFSACGRIVSSKLLRDPEGGTRGVGFVQFAAVEDATRAITSMNGKKVDGRSIYVAPAHKKPDLRVRGEASSGPIGSGGGMGHMYEAVQAAPQWGMVAGSFPGGGMPQVYWQGGVPGTPYPMYHQAPYPMPTPYPMPHSPGPGFLHGFWNGGHGGPGGGFAPGFAPQLPAQMYGGPAQPPQYEQVHRTILQQQQQAHQMQFQMQTGGQGAAFAGQAVGSRGPPLPHYQGVQRLSGAPYAPRIAPQYPVSRPQPSSMQVRPGRGRFNMQAGGRMGPRSGRTASGESEASMAGAPSPARSASASSLPYAAASTPQAAPQPNTMSQPASAPTPTANGGVLLPTAPQQQPEAVSVALQDISIFEASLKLMSVEDAMLKIGEEMFQLVQVHQPDLAGKVTGMLLELGRPDLMDLLRSPAALKGKVNEAIEVLRSAAISKAAEEAALTDAAPHAPQTPSSTSMPAPHAPADAPSIAEYSSNGSGHSALSPVNGSATIALLCAEASAAAVVAVGRLPPVPYGVPVTLNGPVKGAHLLEDLAKQPCELSEDMDKLDMSD